MTWAKFMYLWKSYRPKKIPGLIDKQQQICVSYSQSKKIKCQQVSCFKLSLADDDRLILAADTKVQT